MGIPFIQFISPRGERREEEYECSPELTEKANTFIGDGGQFTCEVLSTGQCAFYAEHKVNDEPQDIAIEICVNGPAIDAAISRLVDKAVNWLGSQAK